jgi:RHS repeat-associated protein
MKIKKKIYLASVLLITLAVLGNASVLSVNSTKRLVMFCLHKTEEGHRRDEYGGADYPFDPSQPGTWDAIETRRYVWDGYNIAAEIVIDEVTSATNVTYYTWGLDLSGTLQGAGGVGGLLAVTTADLAQPDSLTTYYPSYDANGNITEYVDAAGNIRAHYEYSPFGEIVAQSGDLADTFTHRFSTKPFDAETGLVMYQFRPYAPGLGRWMSRDPIEETGGKNLYGFLDNSSLDKIDILGMKPCCNGVPYDRAKECCCGGTIRSKQKVDTGVRICTQYGRKLLNRLSFGDRVPMHVWIEVNGQGIGLYEDRLNWNDEYASNTENTKDRYPTSGKHCIVIEASPCMIDIEHFKASIYYYANSSWLPYHKVFNNCYQFAHRKVNDALKMSRGCTQ